MHNDAILATDVDYDAIRRGAALLALPESGVVRLEGADRVDFLQRMTTNNMVVLPDPGAAVTVLTSPMARILSVFTVVNLGEILLLLPPAGQAAVLTRQLKGQIFFMDKVSVEEVSDAYRRFRLVGPQAETVLAYLGLEELAAAGDGAVAVQDALLVIRQQRLDLPGYDMVIPSGAAPALVHRLQQAHVHLLQDDKAYLVRRMEAGRPAWGTEWSEAYTPLEAGLTWACAENKGCYTGQEIIARQITYDKVTRHLVGLVAREPLQAGMDLTAEGQSVGTVTSAAFSPTLQRHIGLAIVRRAHAQAGTTLDAGGQGVEVAPLPLVDPDP